MEVKTMMDSFLAWLKLLDDSAWAGEFSRLWCMYDMTTSPTQENMRTHFDRKKLNDEFIKRMQDGTLETVKPASFIQADINLIYGVHKCMVARHKSRLMHYQDDIVNKGQRTRCAISLALGRMYAAKKAAENVNSSGN